MGGVASFGFCGCRDVRLLVPSKHLVEVGI